LSQFKLFLCGWLRACLTVYWFITLTWKVKCLKSLIFCFLLFSSSSRNRVCVRFHDLYIAVCRIYVRNSRLMPCLWYIFRLLALYARAQFRTPRVTYSVQFQNGSFWLNGQNIFHTVSLNFQRVVPVSYGFYVASHSFLRVELMCFSLCNDWKTPKFGPNSIQNSGIYNMVEYN
jgi:hypothetical protein